ncbi:MAG: SpoIIE family protein phosphatase [Bryobacteraceae bacterium]|jgi:serine phosphatase RsbU (regulator of sigma subunit)
MTAPQEKRPALVVINPSGNRSRMVLDTFPFTIGRGADNKLVLRDNRASRAHARIVFEGSAYIVEDLNSRHGVYVNGERVKDHKLANSDRIDFGFQDSYKLIFTFEEDEIHRIIEQIAAPRPAAMQAGASLAKLRALVEVARALQSSLSTLDVLTSVVDAALIVTSAERGFLLLRKGEELDVAVARDGMGVSLASTDLRVPMSVINRALKTRRELLYMNFDPLEVQGVRPEMSVADLELRSVICVPLIHIKTGNSQETMLSSINDTIGLLYMDSRDTAADLSAGNREILQTLALEASTILENARLLQEEREKQRMEEELNVARVIQRSLLPSRMPVDGFFRAAGSSIASREVGGDYFDMRQIGPEHWAAIVADVSGKGVSSALLASVLQGAFLFASESGVTIEEAMSRMNHFLNDRTQGEKYATMFYCNVASNGVLRWANAGHPKPVVARRNGELILLGTTGMPLGLLPMAQYSAEQIQLEPGDKVVIYSDGFSEAENDEGEFFDKDGMNNAIRSAAQLGCTEMHAALIEAFESYTEGTVLADDVTLVVLEYAAAD